MRASSGRAAIGATLAEVDDGSIANIPGARVVRRQDFLAVVAETGMECLRAAKHCASAGRAAATCRAPMKSMPRCATAEVARNEADQDRAIRRACCRGAARNMPRATNGRRNRTPPWGRPARSPTTSREVDRVVVLARTHRLRQLLRARLTCRRTRSMSSIWTAPAAMAPMARRRGGRCGADLAQLRTPGARAMDARRRDRLRSQGPAAASRSARRAGCERQHRRLGNRSLAAREHAQSVAPPVAGFLAAGIAQPVGQSVAQVQGNAYPSYELPI